MKTIDLTAHMLVKNEEYWVWYAIQSVLENLKTLYIYDTGSTDKTRKIIQTIQSDKILFEEKGNVDEQGMVRLRNQMLEKTETEWFLLVDADEVWNKDTLSKLREFIAQVDKDVVGIAMQTRNCVGDVYHYLPESAGRYQLLGRKGHLTIRAYRKHPSYSWKGDYPLEAYSDNEGVPINENPELMRFFAGFYWHMTDLPRSPSKEKTLGFRAQKYELGLKLDSAESLPEVFSQKRPPGLYDPLQKRSLSYEIKAALLTPLRRIKRRVIDA